MKHSRLHLSLAGAVFVLCAGHIAAYTLEQLRPGIWAGKGVSELPLPASGYQVYLVGEMHGVKQTESIFGAYLEKLQASGLKDVAIEEDAVYTHDAQEYVAWKSDRLPSELCLRAGIIDTIRRFNKGRSEDRLIRIRLVDVDSPADAIRQHLLAIKSKVNGADVVRVPAVRDIKVHGLETVEQLKGLTGDRRVLRDLRTIQHSILAYRQGFEVSTHQGKGSPYLEDREQAIASNLMDVLQDADCRGVLALYGADHVSKSRRKDGGPERDREFAPTALRLEQAGVRVFSVVIFPLSGRASWRGRQLEMPYTARDGSLTNGETLDRVLHAGREPELLYVDRRQERIRLPSQDVTAFAVDAFLLIPVATPMENRCIAH